MAALRGVTAISRVVSRVVSRRIGTAAHQHSGPGPRLPPGNDPAAYHPVEDAIRDTNRWRIISALFAVPVLGTLIVTVMKPHEHNHAPPEYPYLKMATRSPRFPWGEDDLIGTSYERHAAEHGEGGGH